jgi:hypothetical protein
MQLTEEQEGKLLEVRASGKLSKEDYAQFRPELERLISRHGKIRILFEMEDFHGWSAGALWEEIKLDVKYSADVERVAIVGEKKWQQALAKFAKPFTSAEVRYFDRENSVQARAWAEAA